MNLVDKTLFDRDDRPEAETVGAQPFASPLAPAYVAPVRTEVFKDIVGLTWWVVGLQALNIVPLAGLTLGMLIESAGIAAVFPLGEPETDLERVGAALQPLSVVGALVSFVMMLVWFYQAMRNARALSAGLETTPGWAVGWFFVPFVSLFRPFKTIEEIWKSAQQPLAWRKVETPIVLRVWWGLYIGGAILSLFIRNENATVQAAVGYNLLQLAEAGVFIWLIHRLARQQRVAATQDSIFD